MARKWTVFNDWNGGGFFANGSFRGAGRFRSLNMQKYQNGSIGPRPQFRKLTQSADGASSIPTTASYTRLKWGGGWSSYAPANWNFGAVLLVARTLGGPFNRRIQINNDGTAVYFAAAEIGQLSVGPVDMLPTNEATGIHAIKPVADGSNPVYVSGSIVYDPSADTKSNITPQVISAVNFYQTKAVLYKNRMYGWAPQAGTQAEYIVYSKDSDISDFAGTDNAGNFRLSAAPATFSPALPRGLWAIGSGLLIFSTEGLIRRSPVYESVSAFYADFGRWFFLTGPTPASGTLQPLGFDAGPLFHSLSVVYGGQVLFPIQRAGWAIHDGNKLDKTSLETLTPSQVESEERFANWLHPFATRNVPALFLPYLYNGTDPTSEDITTGHPHNGEFANNGYGGLEFVNGTWTENQYMFGHGNLAHFESFDQDKLYMIHIDSDDSGATYRPQIYTRDITLNRPSTGASQSTYNPFSAGAETDLVFPSASFGPYGPAYMVCFLETGEFQAPDYGEVTPEVLVIDYDYWNATGLFDADCGFDVDIIYRGQRDAEKQQVRINTTRITPPGTSVEFYPKRGREYIPLREQMRCGSFQVRISNLKECAIHTISVGYDDDRVYT